MLGDYSFDPKCKTPIYIQIADLFVSQIEQGILVTDSILPSVRELIKKYNVSKDTIEKAYSELKKRGYIYSVVGKGYFVSSVDKNDKLKILCILNNFSLFKQKIYYSFVNAVGEKASVEFQVYNYNTNTLKEIIEKNLWKFNYFVVTPFFEISTDPDLCTKILKLIPKNKLVFVDRYLPNIKCSKAVYQDFQKDIIEALNETKELLQKYQICSVVLPTYKHQLNAVVECALRQFGEENNLQVNSLDDVSSLSLTKGSVYIMLSDEDLLVLLLKIRNSNFKIGEDIGIISYNESELKDLLNITVVTTDFQKMGETTAELILNNKNELIKNPFKIIKRGSL